MSLAQERGCPECGQTSIERALHQVVPELCPGCRVKRGIRKAFRSQTTGERFCPFCEVRIARGSWALHERSKYHKLQVRIHFAQVLERDAASARTTA